jgi:hypothetical protein
MLADITIIDAPYTLFLLRDADLALMQSLASAPAETRTDLARLGEGVVESILNHPLDTEGRRFIARASYRETVTFDRDRQLWRLGRSPVTVTSVTLDGLDILDDTIVGAATGVIRPPNGGVWPCGARLAVEYDGGWRTPAQLADGAPADAPALPAAIIRAAVRAAALAWSDYKREDLGARSRREDQIDSGSLETTYAAPPIDGGADAEIFRLLSPWQRLVIA